MGAFSAVKNFVLENFWFPAVGKAPDYNMYNTTLYALLFGLAAMYVVLPALRKLEVDIDRDFFIGVTPYILLGASVRVLEDLGLVDTFLLVTPFIYFNMFFLTLGLLYLSKKIETATGRSYHEIFGSIGSIMLLGLLAAIILAGGINLEYALLTLGAFSIASTVLYAATRSLKPELAKYSFLLPIIGHYWDASTSAVGFTFGASEKHIVASIFVDIFGPAGMFVMKTIVIVPVTYYIYTEIDGKERLYYLFIVALLGFALGTRNFVSLAALS